MAEQVLKLYGTLYVVEDIIHNKIFMTNMKAKGIVKMPSIEEAPDGSVIMFSAHGVTPQAVERAEEKELTIIDGTCPIVRAIQNECKKEADAGKKIVIIGNTAHAEIVALLGYTDDSDAFVVYEEGDIDLLPSFAGEKVVYFTQTTLDYSHVQTVVKKLREKIPHIESSSQDNICYATRERQEVVRKIASSVDLLIVVGSAHSSNARRLHEVALSSGAKAATLVDSKNELDDGLLKKVKTIAITSSASTPESIVQELIEYLKETLDLEIENFELPSKNG
jgi:4-hydroxy-3-methylbut-2-enyl diphosphate reductase